MSETARTVGRHVIAFVAAMSLSLAIDLLGYTFAIDAEWFSGWVAASTYIGLAYGFEPAP